MANKPVFDFVPYGGMMESFNNDRLKKELTNSIKQDDLPGKTFDKLKQEQINTLVDDLEYQNELRDLFAGAGVNLITPTMMSHDPNIPFQEGVIKDIARWNARIDTLDWMQPVRSPKDANEVVKNDEVGVILNTQNLGRAIQSTVFDVQDLFNFGLRIGQITYNAQNILGSGCYERSGGKLSHKGVNTVEKMNELGFIIDLSHCGEETTIDTIETSDKPVAFTHTFCMNFADNDRGKTDEEINTLADNDGYMGIQVTPSHIAPGRIDEAYDIFFDNLEYAISILGIDNVGIGTDFGFGPSKDVPKELQEGMRNRIQSRRIKNSSAPEAKVATGFGPIDTYSEFKEVSNELMNRGYTQTEVDKIQGQNFIDFWNKI